MENEQVREAKPLDETPTWGVATVLTVLIVLGFSIHICLKKLGKWLDETKRRSLLAALEKIKEELMLFGLLSLLMGHWILFVAKICVSSSSLSSRFYPCPVNGRTFRETGHVLISSSKYLNDTVAGRFEQIAHLHSYCPEGQESFASYESLEQLHRFLFTLGVTHVSYSFIAIALAMIKISSWRTWENQAKTMAIQSIQGPSEVPSNNVKLGRLFTFISHHVSHPWSEHRVLVWLLCFSRQFWSSISQADYMALRFGFITTHQLPPIYDFHNYMLRSMEEEFRDVVGISVPFWIYALLCIFLNFHGTHIYFWLSFLPAILILLIGTKLHRVVVKLAVEIMHNTPWTGFHQFNLRDELFWFKRPKLVLWLIQLNALEMASFIWSLWEIKDPSCFMDNRSFVIIRLAFGVISQCWCSFITFPLYVIVTQMGSKFKRAVVSENVRISLSKWRKRVQERHNSSVSTTAPDSVAKDTSTSDIITSGGVEEEQSSSENSSSLSRRDPSPSSSSLRCKQLSNEEKLKVPLWHYLQHGSDLSDDDNVSISPK